MKNIPLPNRLNNLIENPIDGYFSFYLTAYEEDANGRVQNHLRISMTDVTGQFSFKEDNNLFDAWIRDVDLHTNEIFGYLDMLKTILWRIPIKILFDETNIPGNSAQKYFYHFYLSIFTSVSWYENDYDMGPLNNPVKYLGNAYKSVDEKLSIERLRNSKVALAYSGGKESRLVKLILDHFNIDFTPISILDEWQSGNRLEDFENKSGAEDIFLGGVNVAPIYTYNKIAKGPFADSLVNKNKGFSTYFEIVPVQRLLILIKMGNAFDMCLFGEEAERHQAYLVDKQLYPTRGFFQSQFYYNMLNNSGLLGSTKLYTPLMNFTQPHILHALYKREIPINSCWELDNLEENGYVGGWCNACNKCCRVAASLTYMFGDDFNNVRGYSELQHNPQVKPVPVSKFLGIHFPTGDATPIFENLQDTINSYGLKDSYTWSSSDYYTHADAPGWAPANMEPVRDVFFDVWEEDDLDLIWEFTHE